MDRGLRRVRRGEVYWADPGRVVGHEQAGHRPVLVISREVFNTANGVALVLAVTSRAPRLGFPLAIRLRSGGLPRTSWVLPGQIRTASIPRLGRRIGQVDDVEADRAVEGLMDIVGP